MKFLLLLLFSLPAFAATEMDIMCLTQNIYHEARGESLQGKIAVGYVTLNRLRSPHFPKSICQVVYQDCQFSWACQDRTEQVNLDEWKDSAEVAVNLLKGKYANNVKNSYYYYNARKVRPRWRHCQETLRIDNHTFCLTHEK